MLEYAVDGLIVVLLVVLLALGASLHLRLRRLRGHGGEFRELVGALNEAVASAERAIVDLKCAALDASTGVAAERNRAGRLADDLHLLTERADREADRLADLIGQVRTCGASAGAPAGHTPVGQEQLERTLRSLR